MVGIARLLNQHDVDSERKIQFWSGVLTLSQNFDFLHELNRLYHVHKTQSSFNNFLTAVDLLLLLLMVVVVMAMAMMMVVVMMMMVMVVMMMMMMIMTMMMLM